MKKALTVAFILITLVIVIYTADLWGCLVFILVSALMYSGAFKGEKHGVWIIGLSVCMIMLNIAVIEYVDAFVWLLPVVAFSDE